MTKQDRARLAMVGGWVLCASLLYWALYGTPAIGIDDANIYFVYVENALAGHGLVYNPGGERVEGFTSMLWTLLLIASGKLTGSYIAAAAAMNVVLVSASLFLAIQAVDRERDTAVSPLMVLLLSVSTLVPGFLDWTVLTLMETGLWCFLLTWVATRLLAHIGGRRIRPWAVPAGMALLTLTRPESLLLNLFFLAAIGTVDVVVPMLQRTRPRLSLLFRSALASGGALAALTGFRMLYFGYPLPNTYYAKVSGDLLYNGFWGAFYVLTSMIQTPHLALVAGLLAFQAALYAARLLQKQLHPRALAQPEHAQDLFLMALVGIAFAIPLYVGGDHFKLLRFFQPYMPIFVIFACRSHFYQAFLGWRAPRLGRATRYLMVVSLMPFIYLSTQTPLHVFRKGESPLQPEFYIAEHGREVGTKLNEMFARVGLPDVGVSAAGGFAVGYQGDTIDMLGLNLTQMAHAEGTVREGTKNHAGFNADVFYELAPEIFFAYRRLSYFTDEARPEALPRLELEPGFADSFANNMYKGIFQEARFEQLYQRALITDPETGLRLFTFVRRDYAAALAAQGYEVQEVGG